MIVAAGPCGPLISANIAISPAVGLLFFLVTMFRFCMMPLLISCIRLLFTVGMSLCVVGVLGCWKMVRFILTVGLKPELVAPAPFLCCDPGLSVDGSGVISDPDRIDEQFRRAWLSFFVGRQRGR